MNIQLADLKREYDLRTVWPNEAYDFTPWLENNLNLLGEAIGVDLCFRERESADQASSAWIYWLLKKEPIIPL